MSFVTSSNIGVSLTTDSTTALFALNTKVLGSDNSIWQYVLATAALTTGQAVTVLGSGTAILTEDASCLTGLGPAGTTGFLDIGFAQFNIAAQSYGFICKEGPQLYVSTSGTCIPATALAFARTGTLVPQVDGVAGSTAAGIFITNTAGSTATKAVATALVKFPRKLITTLLGTM